jgi:hypothetical protein
MEWLLPIVLGGAALAFITQPLWSGMITPLRAARHESWHSVEQLEMDRQLGKIDDAEYEELKPRLPVAAPVAAPISILETIILRTRRQKRLETALEIEVLIERARKNKA